MLPTTPPPRFDGAAPQGEDDGEGAEGDDGAEGGAGGGILGRGLRTLYAANIDLTARRGAPTMLSGQEALPTMTTWTADEDEPDDFLEIPPRLPPLARSRPGPRPPPRSPTAASRASRGARCPACPRPC